MAFTIKQYDQRPLFVVVLKDNFGEEGEAPVDLTTATSAHFNMRGVSGAAAIAAGTVINHLAGTITNRPAGEVTYVWGTGDLNAAGTYEAEIEILWNDSKKETFPNDSYWEIVVTDDIA